MCDYPLTWHRSNTMRKYGVLLLHLQFDFWIAMTTCNLTYFYNVNAIKQVVKVLIEKIIIYETIYMCNSCNYVITKSSQLLCHYIAIIM
jgi:hypothetical protein